jgi:hypothetical protein
MRVLLIGFDLGRKKVRALVDHVQFERSFFLYSFEVEGPCPYWRGSLAMVMAGVGGRVVIFVFSNLPLGLGEMIGDKFCVFLYF